MTRIDAAVGQELDRLTARLNQLRSVVSNLDRCPHGRHLGDACAGWRGPDRFTGGCQGGYSLGNPNADAPIGYDVRGRLLHVADLLEAAQ